MSVPAQVHVTFQPMGISAEVAIGTTVLEAARSAGVMIAAQCGGRGTCGSCAVRVLDGELSDPAEVEANALRHAPEGVRLSCQARVVGSVTVRALQAVPDVRGASRVVSDDAVVGVDLGTTNVACAIADASDAGQMSVGTAPNRQQSFGADVLTRIAAAGDGFASALQDAATESVLDALANAGGTAVGAKRVVIAGNTAMSALLAGADVAPLGVYPFVAPQIPRVLPCDHRLVVALGGAPVELVPPVASFVGGDTTAGLYQTGMLGDTDATLLVDLGTNAEIALAHRGRLWVASAAAGPAFEGTGIGCGGPAIAGSVVSVTLAGDGTFELETLGGSPPVWFTGAGLVSALAVCLKAGIIGADGTIRGSSPAVGRNAEGVACINFRAGQNRIELTQLDIRALQLAKAAVRVGIEQVLDAGRVRPESLNALYVAGAFGAALNAEDLIALGILPRGVRQAVRVIGNASLAGAVAIARAPDDVEGLRARVGNATSVNLALDAGFERGLLRGLALEPFDI